MEEKLNVVKLEDGISYVILEELNYQDTTYVYLTNISDERDFCIRKVKHENDQDLLVGLDDEEEFKLALRLFTIK